MKPSNRLTCFTCLRIVRTSETVSVLDSTQEAGAAGVFEESTPSLVARPIPDVQIYKGIFYHD